MRIAFYAPLKPPTAPTPSGDRRMARTIIAALELAGHRVDLASVLRTRDGEGDANRQARLRGLSQKIAARLIRRYKNGTADRPDLWFTYHVYYKAPDWIGPIVSEALGIPYVIAEASHAPKRQGGPWAIGHDGAEASIRAANRIVGINSSNIPCVQPLVCDPNCIVPIRPFLDTAPFRFTAAVGNDNAVSTALPGPCPVLITTAMMRYGDKLSSYRLLAEALTLLNRLPWQLVIVGDGAARREVETLMAPLGNDRVQFVGQRDNKDMPGLLAAADIFVWPAIREAYSMAILEAQAAGVPVVAGDAGGVADTVRHGATGLLTPEGNAAAFAGAIKDLLTDTARRHAMSISARVTVANEHSLEAAARALDEIVTTAQRRRAA